MRTKRSLRCGFKKYDPTIKICCEGTLQSKYRGSRVALKNACCGITAYNTDDQLCCDHTVQSKGWFWSRKNACCGRNAYNTKRQLCCDGVVKSKFSIRIGKQQQSKLPVLEWFEKRCYRRD